jgi:parallel beta-helix repeat protein
MNRLLNWLRKPRQTRRTPTPRYRPALEPLEDRLLLSTFWVTNTNDTGSGSLRRAIIKANAHAGKDTIAFNIAGAGVHTITPSSDLTTITDPVVIDGTSQPGYAGQPLIELDGASARYEGVRIDAGSTTVRGLVINRFLDNQILIEFAGGDTVADSYLGTDATGTSIFNVGGLGIYIDGESGASSNTLTGNLISGVGGGIEVSGSSNNVVQNNLIGTDASGQLALGNSDAGISIVFSSYNLVGGPNAGNIIAANHGSGIDIEDLGISPCLRNRVEGNFIGTDRTGTLNLGNGKWGVVLASSFPANSGAANSYGNEIGGSAAWLNGSWGSVPTGYGNTIAFNGRDGVRQLGAHMFNNPIRGNSIHDNGGLPISLETRTPFTPIVTFAHAGSITTVSGTVSDPQAEKLLIDFYANIPSEFGQARRYLGSSVILASAFQNGVAPFSASVSATLAGEVVTATATGYYGNTSELATGVPAWADVADPTGGYGMLQTATGHEADGRAVVVALGGDHAVYVQAETAPNSAVYGPWQSLYGYVQAVRVETDAWGHLQVLALGTNNALYVNGQSAANATTWGGWQYLGVPAGTTLQQIEVKDNAAGKPVVLAVGGDHAVYYQWESSPGVWSGWYGLGGYIQSITLGRDFAGRIQVFALGTDHAVYVDGQSYANSVGFNGWQYLGGSSLQQLAVTNDAAGRLTVFALGGDHAVYSQQEDLNGNWGGWTSLGGQVQSIAAGQDSAGRMEVVAVAFDAQVHALRQTAPNGSWGSWSAGFGGSVWSSTLTPGNEADGTLDVFVEFNNIDSSAWGYTRL